MFDTVEELLKQNRLARLFQQRSQARMIYFDEQAVTNAPVTCLDKKLWSKYTNFYSSTNDEEFLLKTRTGKSAGISAIHHRRAQGLGAGGLCVQLAYN